MSEPKPSSTLAAIYTQLRGFCEHQARLARSVNQLRDRELAAIFERYLDIDALALKISVNPCSDEVNGDFAGVIAAGKLDAAHAANHDGKRLFAALELAADALWAGDCLEFTLLARRRGERIEITEHDPRSHPAATLLELIEDGEAIPPGRKPDDEEPPGTPAGRIVLTASDVEDLAAEHSIYVPGGPHGQEIVVHGADFAEHAIAALRAGGTCEIDGFAFAAEQPTRSTESDGGEDAPLGR
jgi:hypothetical protein